MISSQISANNSTSTSSRAVRGGIPIPKSFLMAAESPETTTTTSSAEDEGEPTHLSTAHTTTSPRRTASAASLDKTIAATWCPEHLLITERFLLWQFKKQTRLSFPSFYSVASKVLEQIRSETSNNNSSKDSLPRLSAEPDPAAAMEEDDDDDLTEEERLLYHLLLATVPTLYQMRRLERPHPHNNNNNNTTAGAWYLEPVVKQQQHSTTSLQDRWREFKALLEQRTVPKDKSGSILQAIRDHRRPSRAPRTKTGEPLLPLQPRAAAIPNPNVVVANGVGADRVLLTQRHNNNKSTVEERVRARAAAMAAAEQQQHNENNSNNNNHDHRVDRVWLVRVADGLWSHARQIKAASGRFQKQQPPPPRSSSSSGSSCTLPLADTVAALRQALSQGGAAALGGGGSSWKLSKRQVVQALQQLAHEVPEWLVWLSDGNDGDHHHRSDSLLRLHTTIDYAAVRAQLLGKPRNDNNNNNNNNNSSSSSSSSKRTARGSIIMRTTKGVNSLLHPVSVATSSSSGTAIAAARSQGPPPMKKLRTDRSSATKPFLRPGPDAAAKAVEAVGVEPPGHAARSFQPSPRKIESVSESLSHTATTTGTATNTTSTCAIG